MAQVKSHAYMTGEAGTTTMRGRGIKRRLDSTLENLQDTMKMIETQRNTSWLFLCVYWFVEFLSFLIIHDLKI